jgi:hypothetical protein
LQENRPPKVKNRQIRLLQHTQSASPLKGFRILHGRLDKFGLLATTAVFLFAAAGFFVLMLRMPIARRAANSIGAPRLIPG